MSTDAVISANSYLITCDQVPNTGGALVFSWQNTAEITVSISSSRLVLQVIQSVLG